MVKIVDFKTYERNDGSEFNVLIVQGGIEAVKSQETGKTYFTARKTNVPSTFDTATCESLIGTDFPGVIKKVDVEPYEYTVPTTGEVITLTHSYQYVSEEEIIVNNNVVHQEVL
ncbi:hypothetical protein ABHQ57_03925 [Tenacibaculum sp. ZH5_bin.1]|uniref:hypothetical protein n=1 Tax=Tenacibaculum TaxID=104267 RepID=UPI00143127A5|nr:hypothetical protein [Tenacibaculum mesophilum]KAF9659598.1 hypothetical protein HBA12_04970 [Tenacibaculum mesophilum]